ncbi:unnamed protein product [Schistosoma curassoni]|uniref:Reverse transcriptase domain-containing protein n=1 Tax=Schistosoma curassoni TaxID=6186 RepID=A0A183JZJ3_9TREM|nr:unnamed protein product [Schistosoma curassoni]
MTEDARTKRGADIASDHHLLVAKMKPKLKKHWTAGWTTSRKFNTTLLRDTDKFHEFKITFHNRFQALEDLLKEESTVENNWEGIKKALNSTCQEVLGRKKHHHKECISVDTLDKIQEIKIKETAINNRRTPAKKVKS